jgi:hypothetical protein
MTTINVRTEDLTDIVDVLYEGLLMFGIIDDWDEIINDVILDLGHQAAVEYAAKVQKSYDLVRLLHPEYKLVERDFREETVSFLDGE